MVGTSSTGLPQGDLSKWRQKERLKTSAVALVLCLNIGVDPPDVIKISPCARAECWMDPLSMQPPKALENIGVHACAPLSPSRLCSCQLLPVAAIQMMSSAPCAWAEC